MLGRMSVKKVENTACDLKLERIVSSLPFPSNDFFYLGNFTSTQVYFSRFLGRERETKKRL